MFIKLDPETIGYKAYYDGKSEASNPYEKDSDNYKLWRRGYLNARLEHLYIYG